MQVKEREMAIQKLAISVHYQMHIKFLVPIYSQLPGQMIGVAMHSLGFPVLTADTDSAGTSIYISE